MSDLLEQNHLHKRINSLQPNKQSLLLHRLAQTDIQNTIEVQQLVGFVQSEKDVDPLVLEEYLRKQLPHHMIPTYFIILESLPRTPNGKLDREHLRKIILSKQQEYYISRTSEELDSVEQKLSNIWSKLLNLENVSKHDNFFAVGGHSLMAVRMLAQLRETFDIDLPVAQLVEAPTLTTLANHIHRKLSLKVSQSIVSLKSSGQKTSGVNVYFLPLHRHGGLHYRHLVSHLESDRQFYVFDGFNVDEESTIESLASHYLDELLTFQPDGPYYLCGLSVAGLLAFEMARKLKDRDCDQVEVLLLDTFGPGYPNYLGLSKVIANKMNVWRSSSHPFSMSKIVSILRDLSLYYLGRGYSYYKKLRYQNRSKSQQFSNVKTKAITDETKLQQFTSESAITEDEINAQLEALTRSYFLSSRPYSGSVTLFRGSLQPWNAEYDLSMGWEKYVESEIDIIRIHGDHLGILKRYHAQQLSVQMDRKLKQLDAHYRKNKV